MTLEHLKYVSLVAVLALTIIALFMPANGPNSITLIGAIIKNNSKKKNSIILIVIVIMFSVVALLLQATRQPIDTKSYDLLLRQKTIDLPADIKNGFSGVFSIEYGKDLKSTHCLAFITKLGEETFFWSLKENSLLSIRNSHLISMRAVLPH